MLTQIMSFPWQVLFIVDHNDKIACRKSDLSTKITLEKVTGKIRFTKCQLFLNTKSELLQ